MEEKLYKEDRRENLKMFQGMEKQYSFSKYSGELNQLFGDKCFNKFYNELHSGRKRARDINLYNENPSSNYIHSFQSGSFDLANYKRFLKELQKETKLEEIKKKEYKEKLKLIKTKDDEKNEKKVNLKTKKNLSQVPSIGWYHPNYNSIRKNLPKIFIGNGYIPNKKLEERKKVNSPKKEENEINNSINSEKSSNNNSKIIKNINRRNRNLSLDKEKSNLNLDDDNNNRYSGRRNNALRFSKYSWRKPLISENITSNIICNTEVKESFSPNKIKGLIEFNKMSSNLELGSFLPKKSIIPPLGFYQPNYDFIKSKSPEVYLSRKNPVITKQMKLKKLLYQYNVPKEYELIINLNI